MIVKLQDVVKRVNTNIDRFNTDIEYYLGKGHGECGEIAITEHGNLKEDVGMLGFKFHFAFKPKDTLFFSRSFALRKAGMATYEGLCSDSTYILRTKDENVLLPEYLPAIVQSEEFWEYCDTHHTGGVNFLINWSTLADYEFSLPPLAEQRVLADKLWAAYRLKESYKKLLKATEEMVKSRFIEMFGEMGTTPIGSFVDESFPGEWGAEDKHGNGVKVIRTTNFTNSGKLDLSDVVTRDIENRKIEKKQIKQYDTILERSGGTNENPVGRVVLFDAEGTFLCNNFTQVLRFKNVDPRFAFYSLYYFYQTNKATIRAIGSKTTGIQNLNMKRYLEIGIPNASSKLQQQFVSIAEQADKSGFELRKSIEAIDNVIKSLINNQ